MTHGLHTLKLDHTPFAFLDVETTGLEPRQGHRICEIAVLRTVGRVEVTRFSSLINPGRPISAGAQAVNGITNHMVAQAPRFPQLLNELLPLLDGTVIVAHNVSFDLAFINHELNLAWQAALNNLSVDTLALARHLYGGSGHSLDAWSKRLGLGNTAEHRALGDTLAVRHLFRWLADELRAQGIETLGDLLAYQQGTFAGPSALDEFLPPKLQEALQRGCSILLHYTSGQGVISTRRVDPIRIDVRMGRAYLIGFCHLRQAERSFRVDRIQSIDLPDDT